jgi:2-methylcitrate dehydratase PrpD
MAQETVQLGQFAADLRYEDLPQAVVARARDCVTDTVAACICGAPLTWSRIVIDYVY